MKTTLTLLLMIGFLATSSIARAAPHLSIDLESGKVLSHQQAFDPWHPASLTKLMTSLVAFRAIEAGEVQRDHPVVVSRTARKQPPSRMGYRVGTTITLEDALKLLLVKSANDISVAIAESLAGSVDGFSNRMNREAARLGMTGSRFVNPHGLHDKRQITTARDMALLVRALHKDFPQYKSFFSTPTVLAPSRTKNGKIIQRIYYSYNLLLERFRGGDGFKTGFVCASGYNFIGAATRSGRRIAAVVLGRDGQTSRAVDAAKLIAQGFENGMESGTPIASLKPAGPVPSGPRNMRNVICTQDARAKRYEPGAGQAVIKSPWLLERVVNKSPLKVAFAPRAKTRQQLAQIPLPSFRPADAQPTPTTQSTPPQEQGPSPAAVSLQTRVTLPTFRPGTL